MGKELSLLSCCRRAQLATVYYIFGEVCQAQLSGHRIMTWLGFLLHASPIVHALCGLTLSFTVESWLFCDLDWLGQDIRGKFTSASFGYHQGNTLLCTSHL